MKTNPSTTNPSPAELGRARSGWPMGALFSRTLALACLATLGLLVVLLGAALTWRLEGYLPPRWRQAVLAAFSLVALSGALIGVTTRLEPMQPRA